MYPLQKCEWAPAVPQTTSTFAEVLLPRIKENNLYSTNQATMRQVFYDAWHKARHQQTLSPLESQIVAIIGLHPEYHALLEGRDSLSFSYEDNPFLHLGLHLALREQLSTNRPDGIRLIFEKLCLNKNENEVEHLMMGCLKEVLGRAQQTNTMPDEVIYLALLKELT